MYYNCDISVTDDDSYLHLNVKLSDILIFAQHFLIIRTSMLKSEYYLRNVRECHRLLIILALKIILLICPFGTYAYHIFIFRKGQVLFK
jgi:hypothetical protein